VNGREDERVIVLIGNFEEIRVLEKPKCRWEDALDIKVMEMVCCMWTVFFRLRIEASNKLSVSLNDTQFFELLSNSYFFKDCSELGI
jgi:hypothetical protein